MSIDVGAPPGSGVRSTPDKVKEVESDPVLEAAKQRETGFSLMSWLCRGAMLLAALGTLGGVWVALDESVSAMQEVALVP